MPRIPRVGPVDPQLVVGGVARVEPAPGDNEEAPDAGSDADLVPGDDGGDAVATEPTPAEVRAWAAANGHDVSPHGPVPAAVLKAYRTAQEGTGG